MRPAARYLLFGNRLPGLQLGFATDIYSVDGSRYSSFLSLPGATYTRAGAATAETAAGAIINFAANVPRVTNRGILIEEARTNLALRSAELGVSPWSLLNATVTANATTAPDGTTTADKVVEDATTNPHGIFQSPTVVAGQAYTQSCFAKAAERDFLVMTEGNNVTATAVFNLSTGVVSSVTGNGSPSATITALADGWYRCSLTFTPIATPANLQIRASNAASSAAYAGTPGSGIFAWGAQFELGAFPTSYIPTTGAAATRAADRPRNAVVVNEGTIVVEGVAPASFAGANSPALVSATSTDSLSSYLLPIFAASGAISTLRKSTGGTGSTINTANTVAVNAPFKFAVSFGAGGTDFCCLNGGAVASSAGLALPYANTQLRTGWWDTNPIELNSYAARVRVFPQRLSAAELQALTT